MSGGDPRENRYGSPHTPSPGLRERVARALGREPVDWRKPHTGLSRAERFVLRFGDGSGAFVKAAVDDGTARWLRVEHEIITSMEAEFVSRVLAWQDSGGLPLLVTEDLSGAYWPADQTPVHWKRGQVEQLLQTLREVGASPPLPSLPPAEASFAPKWSALAAEPEPFLALGLCPEAWYREAVDGLLAAEATVEPGGEGLLHGDVRSDNLCFLGERVVLVDWSNAARGNPEQDLATLLGTLPLEGGPEPAEVMPGGGGWAAYLGGLLAWRAAHERLAPTWFVAVLKRIAAIHLAWATRSLGLPTWTGVHWREI